jgi:hypothetical protein
LSRRRRLRFWFRRLSGLYYLLVHRNPRWYLGNSRLLGADHDGLDFRTLRHRVASLPGARKSRSQSVSILPRALPLPKDAVKDAVLPPGPASRRSRYRPGMQGARATPKSRRTSFGGRLSTLRRSVARGNSGRDRQPVRAQPLTVRAKIRSSLH